MFIPDVFYGVLVKKEAVNILNTSVLEDKGAL